LTLSASQAANDAGAIEKISSAYTLTVSDTAANVAANLNALQTLETAIGSTKFSAITLTNGGTPSITLTAAQAANDAAVIEKITSSYSLTVNDSSANVVANLDGLQALENVIGSTKFAAITFTDGGTPHLTVTSAQYFNDANMESKFTGAYTMTVTGISVANSPYAYYNSNVTSFTISDTMANVQAGLAGLQVEAASGKLTSITTTDSGTPALAVTAAQLSSDATAIAKISSTYNELVVADANTTETLTGPGTINNIDFAAETQAVTINLSTGTATTVKSGTTYTYTLHNFEDIVGSAYADTFTAGPNGGVLFGESSADTYVLNASGIDVAKTTAADLNGATIQNFSVLDGIDLTTVAFGANTTLGFVENMNNTQGVLTVSDGTHTAAITLLGQYTTASFQDESDGGSGTLVAMASTTHLSAILAAAQHG
jgi:hypothetical protein